MRVGAWGLTAFCGAILGIWALGWAADDVAAQFPTPQEAVLQRAQGDGSLIALSTVIEGGVQQVTVIDVPNRTMAVYHVEPSSGSIALKCVRNIHADLQIDDLNGQSPSPAEIRDLLLQR